MSLLAWLTLAYVAVLVVALVASLTAIALYLRWTGSLLAEAREALALVEERTAGLEAPLSALSETSGEISDEFREAADRLETAERRLDRIPGTDERKRAG